MARHRHRRRVSTKSISAANGLARRSGLRAVAVLPFQLARADQHFEGGFHADAAHSVS